jgi:hypothetical protein
MLGAKLKGGGMMNWETIIRDYHSQHHTDKQKELNQFRKQTLLEAVVVSATRAKDEDGKHYSHQNKIRREAYPVAKRLLLERLDELQDCKSFHELWLLIKETFEPVSGLGELYIYDISLRIGAFLKLLPDRVYLHRGTRTGAKAFGIVSRNREWIEAEELPRPLRELPSHEVEDILCIYKDETESPKGCSSRRHVSADC